VRFEDHVSTLAAARHKRRDRFRLNALGSSTAAHRAAYRVPYRSLEKTAAVPSAVPPEPVPMMANAVESGGSCRLIAERDRQRTDTQGRDADQEGTLRHVNSPGGKC
jgi:hypothetical protein